MEPEKRELKGLFPKELEALLFEMGLEAFRTRQMIDWLYNKGVTDFGVMSNFTKSVRMELSRRFRIMNLQPVKTVHTEAGDTLKFLFELEDGHRVESVLMREGRRRTVCISSQVGCALKCRFCATGRMGFFRHMSAAEILDQVLFSQRFLRAQKEELTNVVLMGMGEPLLNFRPVIRAVRLMNLDYGAAVGIRRITLSTAGYVPGIRELARENLKLGLAVSLNASTDDQRSQIMPINQRWPLAELLASVKAYQERIGRWVTFEYVLLHGFNDTPADAHRLARLVYGISCKINLIPWNPVAGEAFRRPPRSVIDGFADVLAQTGLTATVRYSKGEDILAGCGQLYQEPGESKPKVPACISP